MIVGVGIDVCDVVRFEETLRRSPGLRTRLFTQVERDLPPQSLAARFAVKEALAKALGAPGGLGWHDAWVPASEGRPPVLTVVGTVQARADDLGVKGFHVSISHDAGVATAIVIAEA
ncbi:MAG: holo-ACP synthase [Dermatophilus congolensis]|nr:holo-ACP synthase [Dermatophilus congolensis]